MSLEQSLAFCTFAFVAAVTPGPSNVMLVATGAAAGLVRGLPCLLGVGAGMASMMFVAALGAAALVTAYPPLLGALRWGGGLFLLWLAWRIAAAPTHGVDAGGRAVGFAEAAAFQWLNPKSWLVSASAAGTYLAAGSGFGHALLVAALFFAVALPSGFVWLAFGTAVRRWLSSPRRRRAFNVSMGGLLAASVVFLLR